LSKCEESVHRVRRHFDSQLYKLVDTKADEKEIEELKRAGIRALSKVKKFTDLYFDYVRRCAIMFGRLATALTTAATRTAIVGRMSSAHA
jgi:hypothetical protein